MRPAFMLLAMLLLFTPAWQALAQSAQYKYWRIRDTKDGPGCAIGVNDQTGAGRQADVRLVVAYDPQSRRFAFLIEGRTGSSRRERPST